MVYVTCSVYTGNVYMWWSAVCVCLKEMGGLVMQLSDTLDNVHQVQLPQKIPIFTVGLIVVKTLKSNII